MVRRDHRRRERADGGEATVTRTAGQNNAGQIVGTVGYNIAAADQFDANNNPNGWKSDSNLFLFGTPQSTTIGPGVIQSNNAPPVPVVNGSAVITINNVPAGTYNLLGTTSIIQPSTQAKQMIGSPRSGNYIVR